MDTLPYFSPVHSLVIYLFCVLSSVWMTFVSGISDLLYERNVSGTKSNKKDESLVWLRIISSARLLDKVVGVLIHFETFKILGAWHMVDCQILKKWATYMQMAVIVNVPGFVYKI